MPAAPFPHDEVARLRALARLDVLDSGAERQFDSIVQAAALVCGVPISLISLVDQSRQWFKANVGLPGATETPREQAFCAHAILDAGILEVPDAAQDLRFADNALVTGEPSIRFYAGMPLTLSNGARVGTLCVIDRKPHHLDARQREILGHLAHAAVEALENRLGARAHAESEFRLAASEARLRIASEAAELALWEWDPMIDKVTQVNERLNGIYGVALKEEPINAARFLREFAHPDDAPEFSRRMAETLATGVRFHFVGRFHRKDDTEERWVELTAHRLPAKGNDPMLVLGTTADVTERKRAEEDLRRLASDLSEADRHKNEFMATLAHELRNPLAPIRTGLQILRQAPGGDPQSVQVHAMLERQIGQLIHLVDDLLDVARFSSGKIELKKQRGDLNNIVASALEACAPLMNANHHELIVNLARDPLLVEVDTTRIAQVIGNLLTNAAKYTPPGGRIEIATHRDGGVAVVEVSDSGVGIATESLSRIFDMFTQLKDDHDRAQGGLGIGLSLVRRLVELHGGSVRAASGGAGRGSAFTVCLPMIDAGAPDAASSGPTLSASPGKRVASRRILVVDDNKDAADSLALLLTLEGHETRVSHDGRNAVTAAHEFLPEAVLLDIGLPGMNGYEVARALRASQSTAGAVLVALTGWGAESDRERSREAGFDRHLTKPVGIESIEAALSELLGPGPSA